MARPTVYGLNAPMGSGLDIMLITDSPRSVLVLVESGTGRIITVSRTPTLIANDAAAEEAMGMLRTAERMASEQPTSYVNDVPQDHGHDCATCPIADMCPLPDAVTYRNGQGHGTHANKGPIGYRVRGTDTIN